jgi:hypothetical protein
VKLTLKQQNDKFREVMESERLSLMKQIDNYKLLVAEFRTEVTRTFNTLLKIELRAKKSSG